MDEEYYESIYRGQLLYAKNEGYEEGRKEARKEWNMNLARKMLLENEPLEKISKYAELSIDVVRELQETLVQG